MPPGAKADVRRWIRRAVIGTAVAAFGVAGLVAVPHGGHAAAGAITFLEQSANEVGQVIPATCDTWVGGVDSNFGTAGNWSTGAVPGAGDDACISATTTTVPKAVADTYTVVLNGGFSVHSLSLGGPNGTQTLVIPSSGVQFNLSAASMINANGVLTLGDPGNSNSALCCSGVNLTNSGHLNTVAGGGGTSNLGLTITNAPNATFDIAGPTVQNADGIINNGTVVIESTGSLKLESPFSGITFTNSGGSITNNGTFTVGNGATFIQRAGTESGTPVLVSGTFTTLDDDLGAGAGSFTINPSAQITLTGTGPNPGVAAGQVVTVGTTSVNQWVTLGVNLTNAGILTMGDSGNGVSHLCCPGTTLTNTGTLTTVVGGGGTRSLQVNLVNSPTGSVDLAAPTLADGSGGATSITNNGTFTIEAASTMALSHGSTFTQASSGTFATTIDVSVNPGTFGQLTGGGDAVTIDGKLKVTTVGSPATGSSWPIISGAARSGQFASLDFGPLNYAVQYLTSGVTLVAQAPCDYWIGGNGNFSTPSNWSYGTVPGPGDDACITQTSTSTPKAAVDTYTVTMDTSLTIGTLKLGAPTGAQALQLAANNTYLFLSSGTINSNGELLLGDNNPANGYTWLGVGNSSGTLSNGGLIRTVQGGGGPRYLRINISNTPTGTIDIASSSTQEDPGGGAQAAITNNGTLTIESGAVLAISNNGIFTSAGGTITNIGTFSQSASRFTMLGGTETGNPILLSGGTTLDDDLGAGAAKFNLSCPNGICPLTGTGANPGVATGQVVTVAATNTDLRIMKSLTNAGTIILGDNSGTGYTLVDQDNNAVVLTNTGRLNMVPGTGGIRYLRANLTNAANGVVDITAADARQDYGGASSVNNGTFKLAAASTYSVSGGSTFTEGSGGAFETTINATSSTFGQLNGGGDAVTIDGELKVTTVGSPAIGSAWPIISGANPRTGQFASFDFGASNYTVQYPAGGVTLVAAAGCDTWLGGVDSSFGTAGNWSFSRVPGSGDDACITATMATTPKAVADTYNVLLNGTFAVHSLTLGGPNGTQTLTIQASASELDLGTNSSVAANGVLVLGDSGNGTSVLMGPGALTNAGHLDTVVGGGGNRNLRLNVTNAGSGTIDVAGPTIQDAVGGSTVFTNDGTVTVEANGNLALSGGASFLNGGGTVTNNGTFKLSGGTFTQRAGTESGNPVLLGANGGATLDDDTTAGTGLFTFPGAPGGPDLLMGTGTSPGVAAGQVVTVASNNIVFIPSITNAGTIVLGDAGAGVTNLDCVGSCTPTGPILTNTGTVRTVQGAGDVRRILVMVANAGGTMDLGGLALQENAGCQPGGGGANNHAITNTGTVRVEVGGNFTAYCGFANNAGGTLADHGSFSVGGVFVQRGTETDNPVLLSDGNSLDDDTSAGPGSFTFTSGHGGLTSTGTHPGVAAGQVVTVASGVTIQVFPNMTNAGSIVLGDAGSGDSALCCTYFTAGATITNTGTLETVQGGGGVRHIQVNIANATGGLIDVAAADTRQDATCGDGASWLTNDNGTFAIEASAHYTVPSCPAGSTHVDTFTQGSGGTFAAHIDANANTLGQLTGGGVVNLNGKLQITTVGVPAIGSRWPVIANTARSGQFTSVDPGGVNYVVTYPAGGVTLVVKGGRYHTLAPARILDTRDGTGGVPAAPLGPNSTLDVHVAGRGMVPANGATAVVVNVTVTDTTGASYLTIYPTGAQRPLASNLNWVAGKTIPNLVEVALGTGGQITVYNAGGNVDVVMDVAGYVTAPTLDNDGLFNPVVPNRVLDTRTGNGAPQAPVRPGQRIDVQITGRPGSGIPGAGVSAVVLNVTVTNTTEAGYLTVFPTGTQQPLASNLNFVAGQTVPNRVIVKVGTGGKVSFYNSGSADVVADVGGWFTDSNPGGAGSTFIGITPTRILDTRTGPVPAGSSTTPLCGNCSLKVPVAGFGNVPAMNSATPPTAVVINVTVTNTSEPSYLTVFPDDATRPLASDLNYVGGQTVPNLVVVRLGADGGITIYNAAGRTDVVIDVVGWYS